MGRNSQQHTLRLFASISGSPLEFADNPKKSTWRLRDPGLLKFTVGNPLVTFYSPKRLLVKRVEVNKTTSNFGEPIALMSDKIPGQYIVNSHGMALDVVPPGIVSGGSDIVYQQDPGRYAQLLPVAHVLPADAERHITKMTADPGTSIVPRTSVLYSIISAQHPTLKADAMGIYVKTKYINDMVERIVTEVSGSMSWLDLEAGDLSIQFLPANAASWKEYVDDIYEHENAEEYSNAHAVLNRTLTISMGFTLTYVFYNELDQ